MFEDPASWPQRRTADDWTWTEGISWVCSADCRPYKRGKLKKSEIWPLWVVTSCPRKKNHF